LLAAGAKLSVDRAVIVHNSNKLAIHLLPCDVLARVAVVGREVAALELEVAQRLADEQSPVASLAAGVQPRVYQRDGFAVTFWTYYEQLTTHELLPAEYADGLARLHAGLRGLDVASPHFTQRVAEAERLVANRDETPALAETDRQLLIDTLQSGRRAIDDRSSAEQLLHGEPHPGNVLTTQDGPVFIDFETCCRGPIEFDVAHVPDEVSTHYPNVDRDLLHECRRLVLAMVAAWRWDNRDEFPNGHQAGRDILTLLREGPPWPVLGSLGVE
jgi:aminoglycoside phosphotransferase (APT) family kinase protein